MGKLSNEYNRDQHPEIVDSEHLIFVCQRLVFWPVMCCYRNVGPRFFGVFRPRRAARNGTVFTISKVKTMSVSCLISITAATTVDDEVYITCSGRAMHKVKLDQLPQFWNVFVGPRLGVPSYVDKLSGEQRRILKLRRGIIEPTSI